MVHWLIWVGLVATVYVLSVGPVFRLYTLGAIPAWAVKIYVPLFILGRHFSAIDRVLEWYVYDLWKAPLNI